MAFPHLFGRSDWERLIPAKSSSQNKEEIAKTIASWMRVCFSHNFNYKNDNHNNEILQTYYYYSYFYHMALHQCS